MLKAAALTTLALSLFIAQPAAAQSKSWAAVKGSVVPQAAFVFGVNLDPIRKTQTYSQLLTMFLDEEEEAKEVFAQIKTACAVDVPTVISDVTVVMKADEKPLVAIGLNGLEEATVIACLEKVATSMTQAAQPIKLTAKKKGKITEYSMPRERKKLYVAWLAKDVLAFTDDPNNKAKLTKMLAGKAPKGDMAAMIGKISTAAPIWAAVSKRETEDGMTILGGYGAVEISGPTVKLLGHLVMQKDADAAKAVAMGNAAIPEMRKQVAGQAAIVKIVDTISLIANGREVDFSVSIADKEIMTVIPQLESIF